MADFAGLDEVEGELGRLASGPDPLVRRLTRRPGQKEERWAQLLTGATPESGATFDSGSMSDTGDDHGTVHARSVSLADEVAILRGDVDALHEEVVRIQEVVEKLRAAFDL